MKRTGEDFSDEEYLIQQRYCGEAFQFPDFSLDKEEEEIWQIAENIGFSSSDVNGVLYLHQRTRRPLIVIMQPEEYQVCYMQKMLSENGEFAGYCFHIFERDDVVGKQITSLLNLLDEYYCTELGVVDEILVSDVIEDMLSFLRLDEAFVQGKEENKERKIIKVKKRDSPTPVVDSDRM